jgi:hypothetical protein
MKHIDEQTLELFVLEAGEVADRAAEISAHLETCAGCRALHREIAEYYRAVDNISKEGEQQATEALVVRSMMLDAPLAGGAIAPGARRLPMKARVVLFVLRHPIMSSTSAAALFIAALMLVNFLQSRKDTNPAYARAEREFLVVYNRDGGELWRLHVGQHFDVAGLAAADYTPENTLTVVDVDGDGRNEVIGTFGVIGEWRNRDAVTCFTAEGTVKWEYHVHRHMVFGAEQFVDAYRVDSFLAGDFDRTGHVQVIAVAHCEMYYPTVVLKLDGATGELQQEYWHSGNLRPPIAEDIDGDGVKELLLAGQNNGFNAAAIIVLDSRAMHGHAPAPPAYTPHGVSPGTQREYALFPVSALGALTDKRPRVTYFSFLAGEQIIASIGETFQGRLYPLLFHLNRSLDCTRVVASDEYVTLYHRLLAEGRVAQPLNSFYLDRLREGIRYWDGEKLVQRKAPRMAS